jgi:hypothetical protein
MKAQILSLALVAAGFTAPALADDSKLALSIEKQGVEALADLRGSLAIQPTAASAQFEQAFADIRALEIYPSSQIASVDAPVAPTAASASASVSPAQFIGEATQDAVSRALQVESKSVSSSNIIQLTVGLGMFGLPWKQ